MNPTKTSQTVLDVVKDVERQFSKVKLFYGHGTDNALDEAVYVIFTVLDIAFDCPQQELEVEIRQEDLQRIESIVRERISSRKPAAYLLNKAWFCGLPFYVNEHVLVPRSPIAELITQQFRPWIDENKIKTILDIGTGSGCIAIACAYALLQANVDAVDNDINALKVTEFNIKFHKLDDRVQAIQSDLFSNIGNNTYDLIVSNPPYVSDDEMEGLPEEYHYEPKQSLRAADDGLALVKIILRKAADYLNDGGILIMEVGFSEEALVKTMPDVPFFWFDFEMGGQGVFMLTEEQLHSFVA